VFPVTATGLIDAVRIGEQPNVVVVALSRQAGPARTTIATADNATRVAIEIPVAESRAPTPDPRVPGTDPRLTATDTSRLPGLEPRQALQTLAIDPGHGGDEIGVRGGNGLEEKQLTLDIARRLRGLVERGLGVRVILTRDEDRTVGIDERAAAANNGKADLLLSIHANGALSGSPSGAEVFFERLDREGEAVRRSAAAGAISLPVVGGGTRSIEVVPWDLAQARHIDASAMLASVLEQELRQRVPMGQRPIQQGPIRLLSAANMPAALVEMAYLTNSAQEKAAAGEEFKNAVAQALYNAIVRFRGYLEETSAP
jgi:N-acetylmuramoyl-L-alanine amidase